MFTWLSCLSVAAGGAVGAVLRYGVNHATVSLWGLNFPIATMIVNILGSFILGLIVGLFAHFGQPAPAMRTFLITGMLGAFTTFSTFSLDSVTLFERSQYGFLAFYLIGSIVFGIGAFLLAIFLVRTLTT
jgi:CrcB protein|tara:strand:+ start:148 stop:537 length:390 start_codon:yes stop_codon:yes gene_type:complete